MWYFCRREQFAPVEYAGIMEKKNDKSQLQLFEGRKVRTVWDEEAQEWFFSVVDVVAVLTDSMDPKQYIKKMRARDPELNLR